MRLKSFYAKTMKDAMQMVRNTLGDDAVIVATREEKTGGVRVTAAVEQSDEDFDAGGFGTPHFELGTAAEPADAQSWLQYDEEDSEGAVAEQLTDVMLRHGVPEEITDQVISCATVLGLGDAGAALSAAIEHLFSFRPLPQANTATTLMMVGPPGAGKTLAVAKLATRAVMGGQRVAVITTDTIRAGGIDQLEAFTRLLRIDLHKAADGKSLRTILESLRGAGQIFIDTGGMNPFNTEDMRTLARLTAAGDIEPILVMPAALDAQESGEIARVYGTLGIHSMMATRLDIARRLGGILSAAHAGSLIFAEASHTPKVADGLIALSPRRLTQLLMPQAARSSQTQEVLRPAPARKQPAKAG